MVRVVTGEPSGAVACGALSVVDGAKVMAAMTSCVCAAAADGKGGMLAVIGLGAGDLHAQAKRQAGVEVS